jgi:glutathione S-transferase
MLTIHRIPFSANCHRVAIAAAHKGVEVRYADHPAGDRSALEALSGQSLVPVVELDGGEILSDSPVILARLEQLAPEPPLCPAGTTARAEATVFVEWFNLVWKVAPNAGDERPTGESVAVFEGLLAERDHLLGDDFGIADVIAWPFLRFADPSLRDPSDHDPFHDVLERSLRLDDAPRLAAWIARVAERPGVREAISA